MKQEENNLNFGGEIPITPGYRKLRLGGIINGEKNLLLKKEKQQQGQLY